MRIFLISLAIAAGVWLVLIGALLVAGRKTAARELALLLPNLIVLFRGLIRDPRVPRGSKLLLTAGALWMVSPIDIIPEFIPVLGPLDDAVVAALILRHLLKKTPRDVLQSHWRGDPASLDAVLRITRAGRGHGPDPASRGE